MVLTFVLVESAIVRNDLAGFERWDSLKGDCFSSFRSQTDCGERKIIVSNFPEIYKFKTIQNHSCNFSSFSGHPHPPRRPLIRLQLREWGFGAWSHQDHQDLINDLIMILRNSPIFGLVHCIVIVMHRNTLDWIKGIKLVTTPRLQLPMRDHLSPPNHRRYLQLHIIVDVQQLNEEEFFLIMKFIAPNISVVLQRDQLSNKNSPTNLSWLLLLSPSCLLLLQYWRTARRAQFVAKEAKTTTKALSGLRPLISPQISLSF